MLELSFPVLVVFYFHTCPQKVAAINCVFGLLLCYGLVNDLVGPTLTAARNSSKIRCIDAVMLGLHNIQTKVHRCIIAKYFHEGVN